MRLKLLQLRLLPLLPLLLLLPLQQSLTMQHLPLLLQEAQSLQANESEEPSMEADDKW